MEDDRIVWCEEERAAYEACRNLLLDGDLIAARMAFKALQENWQKHAARRDRPNGPPAWGMTLSIGWQRWR